MSRCLSRLEIDAYVQGGLAEPDRNLFEAHLDHCQGCHQALIDSELEVVLPPDPRDADGSPAISVAADRFVGPYRLIRELGRGGQAQVYLAEDSRLPRQVALKVFPLSVGLPGGAIDRFRREAAALSKLDHPGICAVYDTGEAEGCSYLAMRYVDGQTLGERIARQAEDKARGIVPDRASTFATVSTFEKLARALHVAHEAGLIHRDVKPSNILITSDGEPVILDFGLVKDKAGLEVSLTRTGDVAGTPAYMSPEQITGGSGRLDRRSHVFSLGIALYEALTLTLPFDAPTTPGIFQQILRGAVPDPVRSNLHIPRDLRVILHTALAKEPHRRYQTALALAEDLRRLRCHESILARPAGPALRLKRWAQRNPAVAVALTAAFVTLATALGIALFFLEKLRAEGEIRAALFRKEEGQRLAFQSTVVLEDNPGQALLLAIEAAKRAQSVASNTALLGALERCHERSRLLGHTNSLTFTAFSPDGLRVATAAWDGTARVWDAGSGEMLGVARGHNGSVATVEFSPDGRRLLTASRDGTARIWDAASWRETVRIQSPDGAIRLARFSRDGRMLVTVSGNTVGLWNADSGGQIHLLQGHTGPVHCARFSPDGMRLATAAADQAVIIWDVVSGQPRLRLEGLAQEAYDVGWSADANRVVAGGGFNSACVWDLRTGQRLSTLTGHTFGIYSAVLSPDGTKAATGSEDFTARIWEVATGAQLFVLPHEHKVIHLELSADGRRLLTAAYDRIGRIWDMASGQLLTTLKGHAAPLVHAAFAPDGQSVVTASIDYTARVWSISAPQPVPLIPAQADGFSYLALSGDSKRVVIAGAALGNDACLLTVSSGAMETRYRGHEGSIARVELSADGSKLVTASRDATARVWDFATGKPLLVLRGHTGPLTTARFSADGAKVVTGSEDSSVRVWNAVTGDGRIAAERLSGEVTTASFSPDGKKLCYAGYFGPVSIADAESGAVALTIPLEHKSAFAAEWHPSSKRVVTSSLTTRASVWDATDGRSLGTLVHPSRVGNVRYSPDGRRVVTHCEDWIVRIWDADSLELLLQLQRPGHQSPAAWINADSQSIAVHFVGIEGRETKRTLLLRYDLDLLAEALKHKPMDLTPEERDHFEIGSREERDALRRAWKGGMTFGWEGGDRK